MAAFEATETTSLTPPAPNSFQGVLQKVNESANQAIQKQKPWNEVFDRNAISKPANFTDAVARMKKNVAYFRFNYGILIFAMVVLSMLWNPFSLFCLALLGALWAYIFMIRTEPIVLGGRTLNERDLVLILSGISIIVAFGFTSVGSILISGIVFGTAIICAHAAFRRTEDLTIEDQEGGVVLSYIDSSLVPSGMPPFSGAP